VLELFQCCFCVVMSFITFSSYLLSNLCTAFSVVSSPLPLVKGPGASFGLLFAYCRFPFRLSFYLVQVIVN